MSLLDFSARQGIHAWLAKAFIAAVALTVLAYGSVPEIPLNLATIAFALLAALSLFHPIGAVAIGRVHAAAILLLAALLVYVVLQASPFAAGDFVNGAWKSVNDLIGPVQGTISVAPGMTLDALPALAMPFLVFLSGLALFQGDAEAVMLWRALAYFGAGYAAFGILQELFLPEQLLFAQKKFYLGSLTASFVNRNTAGTFFGVALLLNLGLLFRSLRKIRINSFLKKVLALDMGWRDKNALVLLHALFCLIIAVALFLTQSRGAVGASFIGAVAGVILMAMRPLTADKPTEQAVKWRQYRNHPRRRSRHWWPVRFVRRPLGLSDGGAGRRGRSMVRLRLDHRGHQRPPNSRNGVRRLSGRVSGLSQRRVRGHFWRVEPRAQLLPRRLSRSRRPVRGRAACRLYGSHRRLRPRAAQPA